MKKLLLSSLAGLILTAGSALAADLGPAPAPAYKAPPPPPPVTSWTGCWISGGVGYGMYNVDQTVESNPGLIPVTQTVGSGGRGWLGRAGVGCDYQFNSFVVGAFGDYDWMNIQGNIAPGALIVAGNMNESAAWAAGGRLGYLVTPSLLGYVDGGYTQTTFDAVNMTGLILGTVISAQIPSNTYSGWFLGGGTEYALNMPWIPIRGLFWRTEYRFSSYDAADLVVFTGGAPSTAAVHMQPYVQTITSSLVWRFNFGGY
jgi:outer membrane immunogenic protein